MYGGDGSFFGLVRTPLVYYGADDKLSGGAHTLVNVYLEMLLQVARGYPGVEARSLTISELRFFYDGLRAELRANSKPT